MTEQIHKRLIEEQVRMILDRYVKSELKIEQALNLLGLKCRRVFKLVKRYKEQGEGFHIEYKRSNEHRMISESLEENIFKELKLDKAWIDDRVIPVSFYNYYSMVSLNQP